MTTDGIAWASNSDQYKNLNLSLQWLDVTDPRFQNWMRISTLPNFRKLWARINHDLEPGTYTLTVNNSTHKNI